MNRLAILLALAFFVGTVVVVAEVASRSRVPVCPEDAVALGTGDYVGGIGWAEYHCEALDNLQ